jgi:CBS domain containing-hemolysin-like protein
MDDPASNSLLVFLEEGPLRVPLTLKLLAMLALVAANAFFVGSEFALVSVRRHRLEALSAAGSRRALSALRLLANPTLFISATQLGVTIASLGLGWIGEPALAGSLEPAAATIAPAGKAAYLSHWIAITIAFAGITILHVVLGELMPKMVALERAEALALFVARPLELFARFFRAPLWVFNKIGMTLGRVLRLKSSLEHTAVYTEAELRQLIDIAREKGNLRAEERQLIHRIFEFSDTLVREAMVPRTAIAAVSFDSSLEEIARAFQKHRYSRLPVYRKSLDDVAGFIHSRDVMPYLLRPQKFRLENVLKPPLYVVDTARLEDVLRQMQKAKVHFGFVVDEHGGVEGIITLEDLLEEIVGEISDEHDEEVSEQIVKVGEQTFLLDGGLAVHDLNRRLKLSVPESEAYTTIGGFLMTAAGHLVQPGEVVKHDGLRFKVETVDRRRLVRVRLELATAAEKPNRSATSGRAAA